MRAWTVDADDIRVAEDFDESLLHRTPEIDSFLTPDRDDKFIVIATKGFGKTLLLKAKRILYQRDGRAGCLPTGNLLDKPIGDKIFGREAIAFLAASPLPWSKLWLTAIALATLKHVGATDGLTVSPRLMRPDRRPAAPGRHRPFRPAPRFHPERAAALRDRYRRTPRAAPPGRQGAAGHLHRRRRRVLQQARRGPRGQPERHRRAVAERVALGTARPRRGRLSTAPYQPSPESVRGGAQGGLRAPAAADRHVPAVSGQRRRHRVLAREPAGDLRQQYPSPQGRPDDPSRAVAHRPARRVPRAIARHAHLHARGRGRLRVRVPPHAAPAARSDDDRRAARRAPARGAARRVPSQGSREPCRHRDRPRVPGGDRSPHRRPRSRAVPAPPARARPDPRRGRESLRGAQCRGGLVG